MDHNEAAYWNLVEWMIKGGSPLDTSLLYPARKWLQEHPDVDPYMLSRVNATLKKLGLDQERPVLTARQIKRRAKLGTVA